VDWMIAAHKLLTRVGLHALTRFLPLVDITGTFPKGLSSEQVREWAILDTFDMFSPEFDNPQRLRDVVAMFLRANTAVTFSVADHGAVVRAVKL
jgi:hypothetical protein